MQKSFFSFARKQKRNTNSFFLIVLFSRFFFSRFFLTFFLTLSKRKSKRKGCFKRWKTLHENIKMKFGEIPHYKAEHSFSQKDGELREQFSPNCSTPWFCLLLLKLFFTLRAKEERTKTFFSTSNTAKHFHHIKQNKRVCIRLDLNQRCPFGAAL